MNPIGIFTIIERLSKDPHAEVKLDGLEVTIGEYTTIFTGDVKVEFVHKPKKKPKRKGRPD